MSEVEHDPVPDEHRFDCFWYVGFIGVRLHEIVLSKTHEEAREMAKGGLRKLLDSDLPFEAEILESWRLALATEEVSSNGDGHA